MMKPTCTFPSSSSAADLCLELSLLWKGRKLPLEIDQIQSIFAKLTKMDPTMIDWEQWSYLLDQMILDISIHEKAWIQGFSIQSCETEYEKEMKEGEFKTYQQFLEKTHNEWIMIHNWIDCHWKQYPQWQSILLKYVNMLPKPVELDEGELHSLSWESFFKRMEIFFSQLDKKKRMKFYDEQFYNHTYQFLDQLAHSTIIMPPLQITHIPSFQSIWKKIQPISTSSVPMMKRITQWTLKHGDQTMCMKWETETEEEIVFPTMEEFDLSSLPISSHLGTLYFEKSKKHDKKVFVPFNQIQMMMEQPFVLFFKPFFESYEAIAEYHPIVHYLHQLWTNFYDEYVFLNQKREKSEKMVHSMGLLNMMYTHWEKLDSMILTEKEQKIRRLDLCNQIWTFMCQCYRTFEVRMKGNREFDEFGEKLCLEEDEMEEWEDDWEMISQMWEEMDLDLDSQLDSKVSTKPIKMTRKEKQMDRKVKKMTHAEKKEAWKKGEDEKRKKKQMVRNRVRQENDF